MTFQIMGTAHLGVPDVGMARCVCEMSVVGRDGCPFHQTVVRVSDTRDALVMGEADDAEEDNQ